MSMQTKTYKFNCKVCTKNYKVGLTPIIPVFSQITRELNVTEIGYCLKAYADVYLLKKTGAQVKLESNTFISVLKNYYDELMFEISQKEIDKIPTVNKEKLEALEEELPEEVVEDTPVITAEVSTDESATEPEETESVPEDILTEAFADLEAEEDGDIDIDLEHEGQ